MQHTLSSAIETTPWDARVFGIETYEITLLNQEVINEALKAPGHYTVKVDPLSSKKLLHDNGFYYCDTSAELYCPRERFVDWKDEKVSISRDMALSDLLAMSRGSFIFGHFHRDFNMDAKCADRRYDNWLTELHKEDKVAPIVYAGEPASFMAHTGNRFLLGAVGEKFRGRGLGKYLWSAVCREVFSADYAQILSPISLCNTVVLNLHISLGFIARNPRDVYHRLVI